jgi:hypothetical protein
LGLPTYTFQESNTNRHSNTTIVETPSVDIEIEPKLQKHGGQSFSKDVSELERIDRLD